MEKIDKRVAGSLTRFYIVALFVVALLTLSGLFLIRKTISSLNHDARVVNLAGRQRMLSQRLTKLVIAKTQRLPLQDSVDFDSLLVIWQENQGQLAESRLETDQGLITWKSEPLHQMFLKIQPVFDSLFYNFSQTNQSENPASAESGQIAKILAMEPVYLAQMNDIVFQFDKESFERLENLERIEWILDIMTILVLFLEGVLIFRPVVNTTRRVVRMLSESENNLRDANQRLKDINTELISTQNDLFLLKEEKYRSQLSEERVRAIAIIEGQELERKRFAMELHDGLGQMLTGLKLNAEKLHSAVVYDEKYHKRFDHLLSLIQDTITSTRQISFNLMPSVLSDFGLGAALGLLCSEMSSSLDIAVIYDGPKERFPLSLNVETSLYRIAQEALNNALKHAHATKIRIGLENYEDRIVLKIEDNGSGFEISGNGESRILSLSHNGIENIKTRASLLNGEVEIISNHESGTDIIVTIMK